MMFREFLLLLPAIFIQYHVAKSQFIGGYALRFAGDCPEQLVDCGIVGIGRDNHACCPGGQVCQRFRASSFIFGCCADEADCFDQAKAANVCADDSWNLYVAGRDTGFCCTNDLVGRQTTLNRGRGRCVIPGSPFPVGDSELEVQPQGSRDLSGLSVPTSRSIGPTSTSVGTSAAPTEEISAAPTEETSGAPSSDPAISEPGDLTLTSENTTPTTSASEAVSTSGGDPPTNTTEGPSRTASQTRLQSPTTSSGMTNYVLNSYFIIQVLAVTLALLF